MRGWIGKTVKTYGIVDCGSQRHSRASSARKLNASVNLRGHNRAPGGHFFAPRWLRFVGLMTRSRSDMSARIRPNSVLNGSTPSIIESSDFTTESTRTNTSSETPGCPFSKRTTAPLDTPARWATRSWVSPWIRLHVETCLPTAPSACSDLKSGGRFFVFAIILSLTFYSQYTQRLRCTVNDSLVYQIKSGGSVDRDQLNTCGPDAPSPA